MFGLTYRIALEPLLKFCLQVSSSIPRVVPRKFPRALRLASSAIGVLSNHGCHIDGRLRAWVGLSIFAVLVSSESLFLRLGDRHCENILLEGMTGEAVHVDFNCLFDKVSASLRRRSNITENLRVGTHLRSQRESSLPPDYQYRCRNGSDRCRRSVVLLPLQLFETSC